MPCCRVKELLCRIDGSVTSYSRKCLLKISFVTLQRRLTDTADISEMGRKISTESYNITYLANYRILTCLSGNTLTKKPNDIDNCTLSISKHFIV